MFEPLEGTQQMLGQLVPCGGGDPIPLLKPRLLVGRRSQCDIALRFPNVSSHHCELEFKDGYWFVRDLNSRNGIKVNGVRCDQKWLMPGDILSIARHKYEIQYTPQSDTPPPEVEEDPFSRSLLEKAGLERRRPARPARTEPPRPRSAPPPVSLDDMSEEERLAWEFLQQSEKRRDEQP